MQGAAGVCLAPVWGHFSPLSSPSPHGQPVRFALCLENPLTLPMAAAASLSAARTGSGRTEVYD